MGMARAIHSLGLNLRGPDEWPPKIAGQLARHDERLAITGHLIPAGERPDHPAVIHRYTKAAIPRFLDLAPTVRRVTEHLSYAASNRVIGVITTIESNVDQRV